MVAQQKLPARQMLHITAAGRKRFVEWLETDISVTSRSIRLEFITRLYFAQRHRPEALAKIFQAQSAEVASKIEQLETLIEQLPPDQIYNRLSLDLRLQQMQSVQRWMSDIKVQFHLSRK